MDIPGPGPLSQLTSANVNGVPPSTGQIASPTTSASASSAGESSFVPTSDLSNLLGWAQQVPQVRQQVIDNVSLRLSAGTLFSPPAPEQVAAALLSSTALVDP